MIQYTIQFQIHNNHKRKYEEMLEEQSDKELASILGISYDELCQLEWDVDTNESSVVKLIMLSK
jgi:hypothetical protein